MKKYLLFFALILGANMAFSQGAARKFTENSNGWYMYMGDHKFAPKWGVHLEAQFRRANIITNGQQLLLRTGLNYHLGKNAFVTAGYCFVETYPYGEFPVKATFPEHRFWEQLQVKTQLDRFEWVSRFRLEQRLSNLPVQMGDLYEPSDAVYTNRFRLLNRFSIPFEGKTIADKSLYLSFYDEIFVNFGEKVGVNIFDQNRAYVALGYKIPKVGKLEVGYLEQTVVKSDGLKIENNHTLQVGLLSNIDFYHKKN